MALKLIIDDPVEVPGPLRQYYVPADGKHRLDIADHPDTARAADLESKLLAVKKEKDEFRANNVALMQKLKAYEGLDADAARAALAKIAAGDDGEVAKLRLKVTELESTAAAATQKHDELLFKHAMSAVALTAGVRPPAVEFVTGIARSLYTLQNGELQPKDGAMPITEWLRELALGPNSFVFEPNRGGGATGQSPTLSLGQRSGVKQLVDPTPQQLGEHAKDIAAGRVKVAYTNG